MCGNPSARIPEICSVIQRFLFGLLFMGAGLAAAQTASFQVFSVTSGPYVVFNLRNSGTVNAKINMVGVRIFHQRPNMDFTPVSPLPGFARYQYEGSFTGKTKTYRYKSVCFFPADSVLSPSAQLSFASGTNYNTSFGDSILAAGISVFCKIDGRDTVIEAFPGGMTPCPGKHIFLNGGTPTAGLKEGSFSYINLAKNACTGSLNMIVYDNASLQRKPVAGFTPLCPGGRKWRSYGFATDSFVYYSFDITSPAGRRGFDSVVQGISNGDFVVLGNQTIQPLSWFDSCKNTLQKLGFGNISLGNSPGYLVMAGKKGLPIGKARYEFCASSHLNCYTSLEQTLVAGLSASELPDFASCFEAYEVATEKGWPLKTYNTSSNDVRVYPNPTRDFWIVKAFAPIAQIEVFDISGRLIQGKIPGSSGIVDASNLPAGSYFIHTTMVDEKHSWVRVCKE